MNPVQDIHFR